MKIIEGVKLTDGALWCLSEAVRRYKNFAVRDGKSIEEAWLGLGTPSTYRDAIKVGVMAPACGRNTPRVLNWYKLTPLGIKVMAAWLAVSSNAIAHPGHGETFHQHPELYAAVIVVAAIVAYFRNPVRA